MPELPEVETSKRGIEPHIINQTIAKIIVRQKKLRWEIPSLLAQQAQEKIITSVSRRGKYLLLALHENNGLIGTIIIHLGMSGSLRICSVADKPQKHDHVDICLHNNKILRYTDPRKFGCILYTNAAVNAHKLIKNLGVEPLEDNFTADYLYKKCLRRKCSIKNLIMNSHIVVGIGNIYACESLFIAKINPQEKAGEISIKKITALVKAIKVILQQAISQGGTTLKDFVAADGKPGYFSQQLKVYARENKTCFVCEHKIKKIIQQQRSTFYCANCQH